MKGDKNLQFCMDSLKSLQKLSEYEPEQKRALEGAQKELRELRRNARPTRAEMYRVVRRVAEAILKVFKGE
ncbi:MAG TPA: hypothetical protein VI636_24920 [Candidatus Angelobacter sp.]